MVEGLDVYVGPAAGVAASALWTATSCFFTAAGRRLGATVVNGTRIGLAIILLAVTHFLLAGTWIPDVLPRQVLFLALSGVVGLAIGDQALFRAYIDIGPRLAMLMMTTSPLFAAFFGWIALGERLEGVAWLGVLLTVGGVAWVVLERPRGGPVVESKLRARGILLGVVAAACQAAGLLLSKQGMGHGWLPESQHLTAQAATLVRMAFAGVGVVPFLYIHHLRRRARVPSVTEPRGVGSRRAGFLFTAAGAMVGPYLGVWMSLVASDRAPLGIAQTLCSLTPVFILPFAARIQNERISPRAVIGAFVAVSGAAVLFLAPG